MGRYFVAMERGEVHNPDDPAIPEISLRSLHADGGHADVPSEVLLGVMLVLKRFSFVGDRLSHVAFGAVLITAYCTSQTICCSRCQ